MDAAQIFNKGCDARLRGDSLGDNPWNPTDAMSWWQWRSGWLHVDKTWATEAKWAVRRLPDVRSEVARGGAACG